jgi:drug/metabolite transporter (DMT)-like permease
MRTSDWLLLVLLSVLWGATFYFIAVANPEIPPFTLVLGRVGVAALALVPVVLLLGLRLPATAAGWWPFVVQAVINNVIPFTLIVYGQQRIASGLAAVLNATTPLFALAVARLFAGEALTASKVAGVVLGIAGVGVLVGPVALGANAASVVGMLCILGASLSYAVSALWMRRLRDIPPLVSSAAQLICSSLMLLPLAGVVERFWQLPVPGAPAILAVLGLALISTALAYVVFFHLNTSAGSTNVMLVTLLIPVTATILGVALLNETLTLNQIAGGGVIASGLVVIDGRLPAGLGRRGVLDS